MLIMIRPFNGTTYSFETKLKKVKLTVSIKQLCEIYFVIDQYAYRLHPWNFTDIKKKRFFKDVI